MTKRIKWKLGLAPILALALTLSACSEQAQSPLAPSDVAVESLSLIDDLRAIAEGRIPDLSARYNSAIIGPAGGVLYVDLHHLLVPAGAVAGPTKFEIQLREDGGIGAKLTATSVNLRGEATGAKNNVGSAGFRRPVYLTFSYAYATDAPRNPSSIKVVRIDAAGKLAAQPTLVNPFFRTATGTLQHFSDYGLAWPSRGEGESGDEGEGGG